MAKSKSIMMDQFHVTVFAPNGLPKQAYVAMRRTLTSTRFGDELRQAIRQVFRRHPALRKARFTITC